jgi:hypothetical protein
MKPAALHLHIEELVLSGFEPRSRRRIGEAFAAELTRLFTERGVPARLERGGSAETLSLEPVAIVPHSRPEQIGSRLAAAVYEGFTR